MSPSRKKLSEADEALVAVMAALAAAVSLLEKTKGANLAAASDTMFTMMLKDYRNVLTEARAYRERKAAEAEDQTINPTLAGYFDGASYLKVLNASGEHILGTDACLRIANALRSSPSGRAVTLHGEKIIGVYRFEAGNYIMTKVPEEKADDAPLF